MKKLIIFLVLFLTSCTADVGNVNKRTLIITDATVPTMKENWAVYIARSYYGEGYSSSIKFMDEKGKYKVGDTIKIVKK